MKLQFEQTSQLSQSLAWVWAQAGNPPANRTRRDKENLTCDDRRFFFALDTPLLLGSPYRFFNSRNKPPANFLECRCLFSL